LGLYLSFSNFLRRKNITLALKLKKKNSYAFSLKDVFVLLFFYS